MAGLVLLWRLRRMIGGLRQQDVAARLGIATTRYSAIERGEKEPTDLERALIERLLPELPSSKEDTKAPRGVPQ